VSTAALYYKGTRVSPDSDLGKMLNEVLGNHKMPSKERLELREKIEAHYQQLEADYRKATRGE
jgi:hypothetical protein